MLVTTIFSLSHNVFYPLIEKNFKSWVTVNLSFATAINMDTDKILLSGKGLKYSPAIKRVKHTFAYHTEHTFLWNSWKPFADNGSHMDIPAECKMHRAWCPWTLLLNDKILDWSKLKTLTDDKINVNEKLQLFFGGKGRKDCRKRRKCWLPAFSPFPTMFLKALSFRVFRVRILW